MPDLTDSKTEKVAQIIREIHQSEIKKLLVVGCGSGLEAAILAQQLGAEVFPAIRDETENYFLKVYEKRGSLVKAIIASELLQFIFPSVYFSGKK